MFGEFCFYYFFHNDITSLPFLMLYVLMGLLIGFFCSAGDWFFNVLLAKPTDPAVSIPNFLRFTMFWGPWLVIDLLEVICKKWCSRAFFPIARLNDNLHRWICKEQRREVGHIA